MPPTPPISSRSSGTGRGVTSCWWPGSASGELVGALRERGIDAWGIENNRVIDAQTPKQLRKYNKLGSIVDMPFRDGEFDFLFETSLCHVTERRVAGAIRELNRVVKTGVVFGSVMSDMAPDLIDRYDLCAGSRSSAPGGNGRSCFSATDLTFDASARLYRRAVGFDACRRQGPRQVVCELRQSPLLVLRQGRSRRLGEIARSNYFAECAAIA